MRVVDLFANDGSCADRIGGTAACGDVIGYTIQETTSAHGGNRVSFVLVEMGGFRSPGAGRLRAARQVEDVREVEQRVCARVEEVCLLPQAYRLTGQRLGLLDVPAPGENTGADGSPHYLGRSNRPDRGTEFAAEIGCLLPFLFRPSQSWPKGDTA